MAHFAKLGIGNIVEKVVVVSNDVALTEQAGIDFLRDTYNDQNAQWFQTSYNNNIRKNFAGIGFKYNEIKDAFIPPRPFNSWILNETTCQWEAPTTYPNTQTQNLTDEEGNPINDRYEWNETTTTWDIVE